MMNIIETKQGYLFEDWGNKLKTFDRMVQQYEKELEEFNKLLNDEETEKVFLIKSANEAMLVCKKASSTKTLKKGEKATNQNLSEQVNTLKAKNKRNNEIADEKILQDLVKEFPGDKFVTDGVLDLEKLEHIAVFYACALDCLSYNYKTGSDLHKMNSVEDIISADSETLNKLARAFIATMLKKAVPSNKLLKSAIHMFFSDNYPDEYKTIREPHDTTLQKRTERLNERIAETQKAIKEMKKSKKETEKSEEKGEEE